MRLMNNVLEVLMERTSLLAQTDGLCGRFPEQKSIFGLLYAFSRLRLTDDFHPPDDDDAIRIRSRRRRSSSGSVVFTFCGKW